MRTPVAAVNILLLNHYAGTPALGMEYRPYYLAREWVRLGHRVLIVGATFSHVRARQPAPGDEAIDGIAYRWLPTPAYHGNGVGRVWNIWRFLAQLWRHAPRIAADFRPGAVIASSTYPMDIWVARRIARLAQAKLAYEVHDLWPLSPIELTGMSPRHPFIRLCQAAEDAAYRDADLVVSMLPKVHAHMAEHGLDLHKLVIVPNGIAPDDWDIAPPPLRDDVAAAIVEHRAAGRVVVGYAGSMGLPNALDTLLDAAAQLGDASIGIVMVGDGHERERLTRRIALERIERVHLLPPIPKAQVPAFLARIDIAYIGWQRSPIYRFGIAPNKLMDYMMASVPVLHSVEAGNDPVAEAGCGLTVEPESPTAVAQGLRRLAALSAAQRRAMGERGRAYVLANHAYPVLAQRFIEALQA
jgi:glycosyltransferase involved in cell wall biosynthesis